MRVTGPQLTRFQRLYGPSNLRAPCSPSWRDDKRRVNGQLAVLRKEGTITHQPMLEPLFSSSS